MNPLLFNQIKFHRYIESEMNAVRLEINSIDEDIFKKHSIKELTKEICKKYEHKAPKLNVSKIFMHKPEDIKVSVKKEGFMNNTLVEGTRFIFFIPFTGNEEVFTIEPSMPDDKKATINDDNLKQKTIHIEPYGEVTGKKIKVFYDVPTNSNIEKVKEGLDNNIKVINKYLDYLTTNFKDYNKRLKVSAEDILQIRKNKLENDYKLAESFGYPIKK